MAYFISIVLAVCVGLFSPPKSKGGIELLAEIVTKVNKEDLEASIKKGSYRGEAGLLRLRPEIAKQFGLKVFFSEAYGEADTLNRQTGQLKAGIQELLAEQPSQRLHKRLAELAALYNQYRSWAKERYLLYREELEGAEDQRLEEGLCAQLMKRLLSNSLSLHSQRLRDSLAHFYNMCHGLKPKRFPLSVENVTFVNRVVSRLQQMAKGTGELKPYNLDRQRPQKEWLGVSDWKSALDENARVYGQELEELIVSNPNGLDPLFVMAVMKRESSFDHEAVSAVGAVGLMQIMPQTAKALGLRFIYEPDYLEEARYLLAHERKLRAQAWAVIEDIRSKDQVELASRAHLLMKEAFEAKEKRVRLFQRYKKDVKTEGRDERLNVQKAIMAGIKYLCKLFRQFKGDLSLVLAAYNAGPSRVKKYGGIPPFEETVTFRNVVLGYYNEYLKRLDSDD